MMRKLLLSLVLLTVSVVASAQMTLTDVPVTFYGKVLGKLNGTEFGLHFGELSLNMTPREQSADALARRFDLVKLDNGEDAFSYQLDIPFHQFLQSTNQPEYYRPDELSESLPIGGTEQPLDLSNIQFLYDGKSYSATVREPYVPTYEFISSQRADIVRLDLVVDLPAELANDDTFAEALYESFLASLPNDAINTSRTEDFDGDGINNFEEIIGGRNPEVNEDRPRLLGDASRLRHVSVLDGTWRPFWMPVEDANTAADQVFVKLEAIPDWIELRSHSTQSPITVADVLTLADYQSGNIWARAKLSSDENPISSDTIRLILGENSAANLLVDEIHNLTVKRLPISRRDGLDSKVWLRADASNSDDGLVHGLSGHDDDRWKGMWESLEEVVAGQDNQRQMRVAQDEYLAFSNADNHWRELQEKSTSTLVALLDASVNDQALFSDGFNVVRRLSVEHPQYPEHIIVEQPTEGKRWVSQAPVKDGWHVVSLSTPRKGEALLWLDGVYAASRSIDIEKKLIQPHPAVGAWYELDRNGLPVVHLANGLSVGEFLGYDRLLDGDTVRAQAAYLLAKWRGVAWVDRLGALTNQVATTKDLPSYFVSGGRNNMFTGGASNDVFLATAGSAEIQGGAGADRFVVGAGSIIKDFTPEEGDVIDLSAILADTIEASDWFEVMDVNVDAANGSTVISVYPQGTANEQTDTIRTVTLLSKTLSKQDLVDFWRAGTFVAGRFRPSVQFTLKESGTAELSEQKTAYRFADVIKTGAGLPSGRRLPLAFSGTATAEDYSLEFRSVTAPDGSPYFDMTSQSNLSSLLALDGEIRVRITAAPDEVAEPEETLVATLMPMPEWYDQGEITEVAATLVDGPDQVSISAGVTEIGEAEGANPLSAEVILSRVGAIDQKLVVNLQTLGNADNGVDYSYVASTATFPAGESKTSVWVRSLKDQIVETDEYVEIILLNDNAYEVSGEDRIKIKIHDAAQTVSLRAVELITTTKSSIKAVVAVERTGVTEGDMTAELELSGTAINNVDYNYVSPLLTFSGTQTSRMVTIEPTNDSVTPIKYIDIKLKPSAQYKMGQAASQRVYLVTDLNSDEDNDGMPDAWEIRNQLDPFTSSAHYDTDGDGLRDVDEYKLNVNPNRSDTDGDGKADGADAFPADSTQTDFIDALYENRIVLSPDLARSTSSGAARLKLSLEAEARPSAGMTLRVYYEKSKVMLEAPVFDEVLGLVESKLSQNDEDNLDNSEATDTFDEWTFYRGENDWYDKMASLNNEIPLSFRWLDDVDNGSKASVNTYVVASGEPVNWQYIGAHLELVNPAPLDIDSDGTIATEDDVRMTLTGFVDDPESSTMNQVQRSGTLESEISEMGVRVRDMGGKLDIDANGVQSLYTDGLLISRYKAGMRGAELIRGAVASNASRSTAEEIEAYLLVVFGGTEQ